MEIGLVSLASGTKVQSFKVEPPNVSILKEYKIKEDTEITNLLCKIIEKTNANDSAIIKNLKLKLLKRSTLLNYRRTFIKFILSQSFLQNIDTDRQS